jgi:hypothetical protein
MTPVENEVSETVAQAMDRNTITWSWQDCSANCANHPSTRIYYGPVIYRRSSKMNRVAIRHLSARGAPSPWK